MPELGEGMTRRTSSLARFLFLDNSVGIASMPDAGSRVRVGRWLVVAAGKTQGWPSSIGGEFLRGAGWGGEWGEGREGCEGA